MKNSEKRQALEAEAKVQSQVVHKGHVFSVRVDTFTVNEHPPKDWMIIEHPGAVCVLPVNERGELLLVKQWRRPTQKILLELPAGGLEKGEKPDLAAGRELREETGFRAEKLTSLGGFFSAPAFCTEYLHFFLAEDLIYDPLPQDVDEAIDLVTLTLDNALQMIDNGTICDLKTIAGVLRYTRIR